MDTLIQKAKNHISQILEHAIEINDTTQIVVIYDEDAPLTKILTEGYRGAVPNARFINFNGLTKETILEEFETLKENDLVVQIQSSNFRLNEFRIRIFLFDQGLKVIEHMHLDRYPEEQWETYINSLAYDPERFRTLGHSIANRLKACSRAEVRTADTALNYESPFEDPKLNIGDYSQLKNVGGTFPIGEVFSEPVHLDKVNGEARIFAFAGLDHQVKIYQPFKVKITNGIMSATDECPQDFLDILHMIEESEPVYVREFGLGLNPALSRENFLVDITAFERVTGLHMSLGAKHNIYKKEGFKRGKDRYHIDVFIQADQILLDDHVLFENGNYTAA